MEFNTLFYLSIMLFCGLAVARLLKQIKMPNVTGYLVAGLIIGPSVLGIIPENIVAEFSIISDIALGFIAFSIGSEFKTSYFKKVGIKPIIIAIFEALCAVILVAVLLIILGFDPAFSIVLGAIAAATAPAATIMVIKQYGAKGPLTETLLCVVAIDDAVALIAFGFATTIANIINHSNITSVFDAALAIARPFLEVIVALVLGAVLGAIFAIPLRWFKKEGNRLCITVAFVFMSVALAKLLGVSDLLTCMAMGALLTNLTRESNVIMRLCDTVTPPILMLFFVASGADLKLSVIPTIGVVGIIYVLARVVGKIFGAWLGSAIVKEPPVVKNYLGFTLLPQAGVAIGLSLAAQTYVPEYASQIRAIILCATFIYEMTGPIIAKITLTKAGEIKKN